MSLFELFGDSSRRKLDSSQEKSTDPPFIPESDFQELIWENRQAMVQGGQSSRARKIPSMLGLPSYYNRDRGDSVLEASNSGDGKGISSSSGRLRTFEPGLNEFPDQVCDDDGDDDIVPWFHCPINDFLPELSGITENNFDLMKRNKETKFHSFANGDVNQVAFPSVGVGAKGSEATGSSTTSTSNVARGHPNSGNFVNFSYFSRPKSLNRSIGWNKSVERAVFSGKQEGPSAEVKQTNGLKCVEANQTHQPHQGIHPEDILPINRSRDENGGTGTKRDIQDAVEPVVASSVCSENVPDGVSDDPTCNLKRKCRETYDSETPSDDMEEDSIVLRAGTSRGNSSKRGRAAEVHNLSERRRRDRINEKMRALQELIPNCNKVDKATMLDEAIEYLKTLQIQVQMMSMGAGMYMPPMMFPREMQPMAQIQAMGMGFGFQMGMVEPNNGIRSLPPPMQATHLLNPYNYPVIGVPGLMSMQRSSMVPFPVGSGTQNNGSVAATTTGLKEPMVNDAVGCSTKSG